MPEQSLSDQVQGFLGLIKPKLDLGSLRMAARKRYAAEIGVPEADVSVQTLIENNTKNLTQDIIDDYAQAYRLTGGGPSGERPSSELRMNPFFVAEGFPGAPEERKRISAAIMTAMLRAFNTGKVSYDDVFSQTATIGLAHGLTIDESRVLGHHIRHAINPAPYETNEADLYG